MLELLRNNADYIIDTSNMKTAQLWAEIKHLVTSGENKKTFMINVMSFGYKKGIPLAADMVFDMRFIPNPYYVKTLRPLTGNNAKVSRYVLKHEVTQEFLEKALDMIHMLVPFYMKEGKYSLTVCIGCTGISSLGGGSQRALQKTQGRRLQDDAGAQGSLRGQAVGYVICIGNKKRTGADASGEEML